MGLRFRKSFGSGPFRVSLGKSGISYSVGTKGARVTKKANGGIRTSVGTNGVYYTKDFGGSSVSRKRKTKKKSGCLTWIAGFIGVLAVFGITLGACSPEEPETKIPEEAPAIVEEQEQTPEVVEEQETPAEKEVIEFEPVFVDPYSGERTDEETTEQTPEEQPIEQQIEQAPVVAPENPVVETPDPVVETEPIAPPVVEPDPVSPPATEPEPVAPPVVEPETQGQIVYITNTGTKYHRDGCRHLDESQIAIDLSAAEAQGYTACGTCH